MGVEMTEKKTKKDSVGPLIYEALQEKRTVPEVIRYVREKSGNEPHERTVYHHINKIREKEKEKEKPKQRLLKKGNRYQIISNEKKNTVDPEYSQWFIDRYTSALERRDQDELLALRAELSEFCMMNRYRIHDKNLLDFLIEHVKKDSYEFFESLGLNMDKYTFTTWDCIASILLVMKQDIYFNYDKKLDEIYKKYRRIDIFFKDIVLDCNRKYGIERLEAFRKLTVMSSPKMYNVTFNLLININPSKKVLFSPGKTIKSDQYNLFKYRIEFVITGLMKNSSIQSRQILFDTYRIRKQQYGRKDKIVKEISRYMEMARNINWERKNKESQESHREFIEMCKEANINPNDDGYID